jgi:hypothetical protein
MSNSSIDVKSEEDCLNLPDKAKRINRVTKLCANRTFLEFSNMQKTQNR